MVFSLQATTRSRHLFSWTDHLSSYIACYDVAAGLSTLESCRGIVDADFANSVTSGTSDSNEIQRVQNCSRHSALYKLP